MDRSQKRRQRSSRRCDFVCLYSITWANKIFSTRWRNWLELYSIWSSNNKSIDTMSDRWRRNTASKIVQLNEYFVERRQRPKSMGNAECLFCLDSLMQFWLIWKRNKMFVNKQCFKRAAFCSACTCKSHLSHSIIPFGFGIVAVLALIAVPKDKPIVCIARTGCCWFFVEQFVAGSFPLFAFVPGACSIQIVC